MYQIINTRYGNIAYIDTLHDKQAVIFIHGNSSCKEVFEHQFKSDLANNYRLIAFDLPGHGNSVRAENPLTTYTIPHFAKLLVELVEQLSIVRPVVVGWSLGGHIALEAAAQGLAAKALLITGTPPFGPGSEGMETAFHLGNHMALVSKETFTQEDAINYATGTVGGEELVSEYLLSQVKNCDGRARKTMFNQWSITGNGHPAIPFIAKWEHPIAVIHGERDAYVKADYLRKLVWKNLWRQEIIIIDDVGHAPFLESPKVFNWLLSEFIEECGYVA